MFTPYHIEMQGTSSPMTRPQVFRGPALLLMMADHHCRYVGFEPSLQMAVRCRMNDVDRGANGLAVTANLKTEFGKP